NGLDTPWGEADVAAACRAGPDAILLPKVESAAQVRRLAALMEAADAPAKTAIWCMMETPRGMLHVEAIADAHERLAAFVMGTSDLVKDLHAAHTPMRLPVLASLSLCVLAARAAGLAILDGVYLDIKADAGLADACRQGAELGFDGKTLIHPGQIAAANAAFAPSAADIAAARRIIAAHGEAAKAGQGVVVVDGRLVEALHVEQAHRTVALAEAIARLQA
ncbi:MAG: CoA ester lyase, partial [Alphaproteobacteria bacterium]